MISTSSSIRYLLRMRGAKAWHPGNFLNEGSAAAILAVGDVVPARLTFPVKSGSLQSCG